MPETAESQVIIDDTHRTTPCDQCGARAGEKCRGGMGETRHTPHIKRIRAYLLAHPEVKPDVATVTNRASRGTNRNMTRATIKRIRAAQG